jgi:hypothetical protein
MIFEKIVFLGQITHGGGSGGGSSRIGSGIGGGGFGMGGNVWVNRIYWFI